MSDFSRIQEIIDSIPQNTFKGNQPEFLYELSMGIKVEGEVVEIGTNVGKSTIALGFAQKCRQDAPLTTIDIYQHPDIEANLENAGVTPYVNRIISPSHLQAKTWNKPIRLLWIDGDHSHRGALKDIRVWSPHLVEGGFIALHDYPGHKGSLAVYRAVQKTLISQPYEYRLHADRVSGSIIVFEKIGKGSKQVRSLRGACYWWLRDMRSLFVETFPNLSSRIISRLKEK